MNFSNSITERRLSIRRSSKIVCPITSAWELHKAFPEAEFIVVPDAGHSVSEPGITAALVDAMDKFRDLK